MAALHMASCPASLSLRAAPPTQLAPLASPRQKARLPQQQQHLQQRHLLGPCPWGRPAAPRRPGRASLNVSASATPASGSGPLSLDGADNSVDLCIFPMWTMPLPTASGSLNVFEAPLVALLRVVQQVAASSMGEVPARFGALPYDWVQRQMRMDAPKEDPLAGVSYLSDSPAAALGELSDEDKAVLGCCCQIDAALEEPQGDVYWVQYHARRRFRPLKVLRRQPFLVVRGEWVEDDRERSHAAQEGVTLEELEQQVWAHIQEVVSYTSKLAGNAEPAQCCGGPGAVLPEAVCKFSPIAPPRPTTAEERVRSWTSNPQSRMPAEVAVWRNMRSATAVAPKKAPVAVEPIPKDPYCAAAERISKAVRQEAFSFAAASIVELGPEQRNELLAMTNTAERLRWLLEAIEPHLATLRTEYSMRKAMGDL